MKDLTQRQIEILDYIEKYISVHHFPPSFRTLQKAFSFSSLGTVSNLVRSLKKKGALQKRGRLMPTREAEENISVPIMSKLLSGSPLQLYRDPKSMTLPKHMATETSYLIRIEKEEGFLKGDLIVVEPRVAKASETVIAVIDEKHTFIRRFFSDEQIYLEGESDRLIFRPEHVTILGVVTRLIRSL